MRTRTARRAHAIYQVTPAVLGRRRATQALPVRPSSRRRSRESARRQPKDLPVGSDVTAQTADHFASDRSPISRAGPGARLAGLRLLRWLRRAREPELAAELS